ncbi:25775_t:CDS:2, partial [Racocetra persica]
LEITRDWNHEKLCRKLIGPLNYKLHDYINFGTSDISSKIAYILYASTHSKKHGYLNLKPDDICD